MRSIAKFIIGKSINVVPIWNNNGFISGMDKLITMLIKTIAKIDKLKIIVNENHDCCWLLLSKLREDKFSVSNFINKKKIEETPKLTLAMMSFNIPKISINVFDGVKFNFLIHK